MTSSNSIYPDLDELRKRIHRIERLHRGELIEKLELAMWAADMAWWDYHRPSGRVEFHPAKAEMIGFAPDQAGRNLEFWIDRIHPDDREDAMQAMRKHLEGEAPAYEVRYRLRTDSGEWRWFWDRGRIVERGKNGEPVRVTGMVRDITELKELETAYLSLAARVTSAQEDERARISRELHDGVGQDLAAIKLKSHNLAETIESSDPYKALREAGELIEIAQGSLEELRRIVYDLRPPALDDLDFMQVLEWLCVRVKRHFGIVVRPRLAVDQNKCLSLHKTVVFRVVQEALHNCAQHAGVECVDLRLENDDDELVVEVIDKGKGFDIKTTPQGVGLSGMRDRVESLGGRFRIESATGAGTKVHAKIPLKLGRDFV